MFCAVFNHSVPCTTQKREHNAEDIQGSEINVEEPDSTEDGKSLLHIS
jgi:hypothetical protein